MRRQRGWQSVGPQEGLTLTQLMATLAITALLVSIGIPSYRYVTYSNRVSTEVNSLLGDMQYTRSEAVKEGATVTICPSNSAQTQCLDSSAWQGGWIIFSDVHNNARVTSPTNILRVRAPFAPAPQDSFVSESGLIYVSFNREGFASSFPATSSGYVTFTLHISPHNSQWTRCLQVFSTGMMETEKTSDAQGNCT